MLALVRKNAVPSRPKKSFPRFRGIVHRALNEDACWAIAVIVKADGDYRFVSTGGPSKFQALGCLEAIKYELLQSAED